MVPATADPRGGLFATVKDASTAFDLNSPDGNHGISMLAEDAGAQISLSGAGASLQLGGTQVVTTQQAAVADPAGGTIIDIECRAQLAAWLARARAHGLIDT